MDQPEKDPRDQWPFLNMARMSLPVVAALAFSFCRDRALTLNVELMVWVMVIWYLILGLLFSTAAGYRPRQVLRWASHWLFWFFLP